jgi:hypothetical protein
MMDLEIAVTVAQSSSMGNLKKLLCSSVANVVGNISSV